MRIGAGDNMFALKGTLRLSIAQGGASGFIECLETKDFFASNMQISEELLVKMTLVDGTLVAFNARIRDDGNPEATEMEPCDVEWEPIPADLSTSGEVPGPAGERTNLRWNSSSQSQGAWASTSFSK